MSDSLLHLHFNNTQHGNIFWENGDSSRSPETCRYRFMPRSFKAVVWDQHLSKTPYVGFSSNLSPFCVFELLPSSGSRTTYDSIETDHWKLVVAHSD